MKADREIRTDRRRRRGEVGEYIEELRVVERGTGGLWVVERWTGGSLVVERRAGGLWVVERESGVL